MEVFEHRDAGMREEHNYSGRGANSALLWRPAGCDPSLSLARPGSWTLASLAQITDQTPSSSISNHKHTTPAISVQNHGTVTFDTVR